MLKLRALGNAEIQTGKTTLTPSQEIVFACALYLILERGKRVSRTGLAELLWPGVELPIRSHRMRQTLLQLKKLGVSLTADRDIINLETNVHVDFRDDQLDDGSLEGRHSLEFLPGYSPRFSETFRDWVDTQRSTAHSHCTRSLLTKLAIERARGNWSPLERLARQILQLDPYNETAVLALAEATAMRGQKREAVAMLETYSREVGKNADLKLPAALLRKRILLPGSHVTSPGLTEAAFVGRELEMEMLTRALKEAQRGRGGACILIGEPGIGKTRLATELVKFSELQGFATQVVNCPRSNTDRPLSVLVDLVPPLREMPGALGCSQETLVALRRLTEFNGRGVEVSVSSAESQALYRALRHALFDLVDAITDEVPLLLVLDDIQWIDKTSAEVISAMATWGKTKRLLFLLNCRSDATSSVDLCTLPDAEVIRLNALTRPSAKAILETIVSGRPSRDHDKSPWILDVSEGNPFFLQELAKHWLECGDFSDPPSSVSKVLRNRLSRLSPTACRVLQACTILGQNSTLERVERVLEYASHDLLGAIEELSTAGMLTCSVDSTELAPLSIHPRHDLLSIAVLESIGSASQAFLHRRAGLVLEQELAGDRVSTAVLWACAFHWRHAGERDRALAVVRAYAEHLLEIGLPEDASTALDRALDYCSSNEHRISLLARQAEVRQIAGKWEESKRLLRACRELREKITPSSDKHDRFEIMLFDAAARTSVVIEEPLWDVLQCVEANEASPEHRVEAAVLALKLATNLDQDIVDAIYRQIEPLDVEIGINKTSRVETELVYQSSRGDLKKGLVAGQTLVQLERQSRDLGRLVRALMNAGSGCRISASDSEGEEYLSEAIDCSLKHHMIERAKVSMQLMVRLHLSMCNVTLAREMLDRSKRLPVSPENRPSIIEQGVLEARVSLEEGRLEESAGVFYPIQEFLFAAGGTRRAMCLALDLRFGLIAGRDPQVLLPAVTQLESCQRKLRGMGLQDFETESLYLGLKATGNEEKGRALVGDYVHNQRRDLRPLPPSLASVFAS
ncbi:MAG TPA: AAA family ATPase [Gemmatimonadaceae bacterium]|nr:AAA family ATPase [Gemmatimonadaceae bacterium]